MHAKKYCVPALAGGLMLCAAFLPWLRYPQGSAYGTYITTAAAWQLPVDIGWQIRCPLFNYGLLCIVCALPAFAAAHTHRKQWQQAEKAIAHKSRGKSNPFFAGICCMTPILLFIFQYLCVDMQSMNSLAHQKMQMLLIENLYGYKVPAQLIQLQPFEIDSSTLTGRVGLLLNQVSSGLIVPCLSALLLLYCQPLLPTASPKFTQEAMRTRPRIRKRVRLVFMTIGIVLLSRPMIAMIGDDQAREALTVGNYPAAMRWLDVAETFNPALDQVPYYHIQRGQAEYFLHPTDLTNNSRIYLASAYLEQGNYPGAYQEMHIIQHLLHSIPAWEVDIMDEGLSRLAETARRRNGLTIQRPELDAAVLPWLKVMMQIDASNVYAQYLMGRTYYDLHNYEDCIAHMTSVLRLSMDANLQSSAYTYIALSLIKQGKLAAGRALLLKAVELDPEYWNNTAREELSGLH